MGRGNERGGVERCTFCEKSRSEVQSLIAGPPGIYICNECVDICNSILREETRRVAQVATESSTLPTEIPTPREIVDHLEEYVYGQSQAKNVLAVAVHRQHSRVVAATEIGVAHRGAHGRRSARQDDFRQVAVLFVARMELVGNIGGWRKPRNLFQIDDWLLSSTTSILHALAIG